MTLKEWAAEAKVRARQAMREWVRASVDEDEERLECWRRISQLWLKVEARIEALMDRLEFSTPRLRELDAKSGRPGV